MENCGFRRLLTAIVVFGCWHCWYWIPPQANAVVISHETLWPCSNESNFAGLIILNWHELNTIKRLHKRCKPANSDLSTLSYAVVFGVTYSRYSATVHVFDGRLMICRCYGEGGVGWGGVGGPKTFNYTSTQTSCYATAGSSCTSTHTSCYATAGSSCTCTHTHTSCCAIAGSSSTCTHTHTRHATLLQVLLALAHTPHATLLPVFLALPHARFATLVHVPLALAHTRHATLLQVLLALTCHATLLQVLLALAHTRHATLLQVLLALPRTRHATLLQVLLALAHTHTRHATVLQVLPALAHSRHATLGWGGVGWGG